MFGKLGTMEIIVILVIALIIFGPSKLPELGKAVGNTIKSFKSGLTETSEETKETTSE